MLLPNDEIGISDILAWRDCPRRMQFGMRRHSGQDAPESESPATAYGSAAHLVIELVDNGATDEEAIAEAFKQYGGWLEPRDITQLHKDLETYRGRDYKGVRIVAQEDNLRVPLMEYEGRQIYFRFKLDKLYQRLDNEGAFIMVDYKSSKYAKSEEEVHEDLQMWAYNWAIHEYFPECESLIQTYDQLKFGQITTRKTPEQRAQMHEWLKAAVTAVLADDKVEPKLNRWCAYCPIMVDCKVIPQLSDYAISRIATLAPTVKEGRKKVVKLDPALFDVYVNELPKVKDARKILERFAEEVGKTIKELPEDRQAELGYATQTRGAIQWDAQRLRDVHEMLGDEFYEIVGVTKTRIEKFYEGDPETQEGILALAEKIDGASVLTGGPQTG